MIVNDLINFLSVNGYVNIAEAIKNLLPVTSFHWFDEIVELSFAALVFYGAAALWGPSSISALETGSLHACQTSG